MLFEYHFRCISLSNYYNSIAVFFIPYCKGEAEREWCPLRSPIGPRNFLAHEHLIQLPKI